MRVRGSGYWELFIPHAKPGDHYKFEIIGPHGHLLPLKSDPMAFASEAARLGSESCTVIWINCVLASAATDTSDFSFASVRPRYCEAIWVSSPSPSASCA